VRVDGKAVNKLFVVLATVLGLVLMPSAVAEAKPKPGPGWSSKTVKFALAKKRLVLQPTQVWIDVQTPAPDQDLGNAAWWSAAFFNEYTVTKFNCTTQLMKVGPVCVNTPCPTSGWCLQVRYGDLPAGTVAKYEALYCSGGCTRAGRITVDTDEVPFGGYHPWGPYERSLVLTHYFGRYIGMPANTECVDVMNTTFRCNGDSTPRTLKPSNAAIAAAW
jgi:hypothetical protein